MYLVNPCANYTCGENALCVSQGETVTSCICPSGFTGDPYEACTAGKWFCT